MKETRKSFEGIAASPGIAIGSAFVLETSEISIPKYWLNEREVDAELKRFQQALQKTKEQFKQIKSRLCRYQGQDQMRILDSYTLILQDDLLLKDTRESIRQEHINVEWALFKTLEKIKKTFLAIDEEYFKERQSDVDYVGTQLIKSLTGHKSDSMLKVPKHAVIVAHDLSPAEITELTKFSVKALIVELGGKTSHMAIVARSLEIPAVVGCPLVTSQLQSGDEVVVDGEKGEVIFKPTSAQKQKYTKDRLALKKEEQLLLKNIHLPSETKDKKQIRLSGNMEMVEEVDSIIEHGAQGIGLFRTEFAYLGKEKLPEEDELFRQYQYVLKNVYPNAATIRTFDMGGDKIPLNYDSNELNPALGLRAIRLCLKEPKLFKTQLRALLRASAFGKLKILFPMITSVEEVKKAKQILERVKKELKRKDIPFDPKIKIGIMIEVPAAVMIADDLAKEVDFFSIGTNDLIQYGLAIDRSNESVAYLYQPLHPAILRMIKQVVSAALKEQIEVSVCGEMAGDPLCILILLGFGLHELSMNAVSIPLVKTIIRSINYDQARSLLEKVMSRASSSDIEESVAKEMLESLGPKFKKYFV